jgi:YidC/Oxa1 family membrane protein insertase
VNTRTLLGILIIFAIFFLSEQFIWKKAKPVPAPQNQTQQTKPAETPQTQPDAKSANQVPLILIAPDSNLPAVNDNIVLENDSLKLVFSNKGATIREVYLKKFLLADKSIVQLVPASKKLANTVLLAESGSTDLKDLPFNFERIDNQGKSGIRFYFNPDSTRSIEKTFTLGNKYGVDYKLKIHSTNALVGYSHDFGSGINDTELYVKTKGQDYMFFTQIDNMPVKRALSKLIKGSVDQKGKVDWAAIRTKYFMIACADKSPVLTNSVKADTANGNPAFSLTKRDKAFKDWDEDFTLYLGPASFELLRSYGIGWENVAERGAKWLRWLVDIFAWFLNLLYRLVPNYGVVILIFSVVLKVILHPLTHKSMDASLKMQKIQPQVGAIQAQYKSDPKRMQIELSKLYKEAGASPLGGCLPLLLQMPVFFALYTVLRFSLDMRMAGFVGWLKDLSEPDPLYILPILMGVFMIVQQLMMIPKKEQLDQMDEKQKAMQQSQKMMTWIMPVVLFFVFKSMPAGLVLYWTVFNILSIIQQYYLQKHLNKKEILNEEH